MSVTNTTRGKHSISLAENKVNSTSVVYDRMSRRWELPETLLGGTIAMREAGKKYLPQEPKEKEKSWQNRRDRSVLFNAYESTIKNAVSKPFGQNVVIENEEKLDQRLHVISDNADLKGCNLTDFAKNLFFTAIHRGVCHVLVDYPTVSEDLTLGQEIKLGIRPSFTLVDPIDLPGWRFRIKRSGELALTQIRVKETRIEEAGEFGETIVDVIRVITAPTHSDEVMLDQFLNQAITREIFLASGGKLGEIRTFSRTTDDSDDLPENKTRASNFEDEEYVEDKSKRGFHTFPGIPLRSLYFNRTGFMQAEPVLEDLAWLNLAHWQSYSDQRNILRFARVGILFMSGVTNKEYNQDLVVGPTQLWRSTNPEADLKHVEHNGKAIESGWKDLEILKEDMEVHGLQPFVGRSGNITATARAIDSSKEHSGIQAMIIATQILLVQCYSDACTWIGEEIPEDFDISIHSDFTIGLRSSEDTDKLIELRNPMNPQISHDTFIAEIKRRSLLSEDVDAETERQKIQDEDFVVNNQGRDDDDEPEIEDDDEDETEIEDEKPEEE